MHYNFYTFPHILPLKKQLPPMFHPNSTIDVPSYHHSHRHTHLNLTYSIFSAFLRIYSHTSFFPHPIFLYVHSTLAFSHTVSLILFKRMNNISTSLIRTTLFSLWIIQLTNGCILSGFLLIRWASFYAELMFLHRLCMLHYWFFYGVKLVKLAGFWLLGGHNPFSPLVIVNEV